MRRSNERLHHKYEALLISTANQPPQVVVALAVVFHHTTPQQGITRGKTAKEHLHGKSRQSRMHTTHTTCHEAPHPTFQHSERMCSMRSPPDTAMERRCLKSAGTISRSYSRLQREGMCACEVSDVNAWCERTCEEMVCVHGPVFERARIYMDILNLA